MISKPSIRVLESLANLEHNTNFIAIREWLEESLRASYERCAEEKDEITLRQAQGAAIDLKELLSIAGSARENTERLRK